MERIEIETTNVYPKITSKYDLEIGKNYCGTTGDGENVPGTVKAVYGKEDSIIESFKLYRVNIELVISNGPLEGLCGTRPNGECDGCRYNQVAKTVVEFYRGGIPH